MTDASNPVAEVFPLLWTRDVARILNWAVTSLGLTESWRAPGDAGQLEHAELRWPGGKISVNIRQDRYQHLGPAGIALRMDDRERIEATHELALHCGARIIQPLAESRVAYSFTAEDPDGNQWWVHAETGFLDELRESGPGSG